MILPVPSTYSRVSFDLPPRNRKRRRERNEGKEGEIRVLPVKHEESERPYSDKITVNSQDLMMKKEKEGTGRDGGYEEKEPFFVRYLSGVH